MRGGCAVIARRLRGSCTVVALRLRGRHAGAALLGVRGQQRSLHEQAQPLSDPTALPLVRGPREPNESGDKLVEHHGRRAAVVVVVVAAAVVDRIQGVGVDVESE